MASLSVLSKGNALDKVQVKPVEEDELQTPQRSITDFFKSPTSKQQKPIQFLSSTPKENVKPNKLFNTTFGESPKLQESNEIKAKSSKSKISKVTNGTGSNENVEELSPNNVHKEDDLNLSGISRRVRHKKKKKCKRKDSLDDQFIETFDSIRVISDTSTDNISLSNNSQSFSSGNQFQKVNMSKHIKEQNSEIVDAHSNKTKSPKLSGKSDTKSHKTKKSKLSQKNDAGTVKETTLKEENPKAVISDAQTNNSKKSKLKMPVEINTEKEDETIKATTEKTVEKDKTTKIKRKRQSNIDESEVTVSSKRSRLATKSEKTDVPFENGPKVNEDKDCASVSYEDYLKDLGDPEESTVDHPEPIETENYPSVSDFFTKVLKPQDAEIEKVTNNTVTVTVDVHEEPIKSTKVFDLFTKKPKLKENPKPIILSPNSSSISVEDEIVLISSEIQEDDNLSPNNKSNIQTKDTSLEIDESTTPKPFKISKEACAFLKNDTIITASSKTAQATLSFTKSGLKTDKSNLIKETVPLPNEEQEIMMKAVTTPNKEKLPKPNSKKSKINSEKATESVTELNKTAQKSNENVKKTKLSKTKSKNSKSKIKSDSPDDCKQAKCTEDVTKDKLSKITTKKAKKSKEIDNNIADDESLNETPKKSSRKFKVTSLQFDDKNKTPIKMKIRCKRSYGNISPEESEFTPRSKKHSAKKDSAKKLLVKAQELLVKAKKKKSKTSEEKPATSKKVISNHRFSPRLAKKPNISLEEVIDLDEEEEDDIVEIIKETPNKSKPNKVKPTAVKSSTKTPIKSKPPKSPSKSSTPKKAGKIASIFASSKKVTSTPEKIKPPEDPEKVKLRQAFLSSGIPDEVKKQTPTVCVPVLSEYIPFPTTSHTQQLENVVSTSTNKQLPIKLLSHSPCYSGCQIKWSDLNLKQLYKDDPSLQCDIFTTFKRHPLLSDESVPQLLEEIKQYSTVYQFNNMFESLKSKKLEDLKSTNNEDLTDTDKPKLEETEVISIDDDENGKVKKKKKLKKKKNRKSSEELIVNNPAPLLSTSESQWPERYQPTHSTDMIGNTSNITKLKTWLLEWKHKTHKDARKMKKLLSKQSKSSSKPSSQDSGWIREDSDFYSEDSEDEEDTLCNTMLITGPHGIGKTSTVYALAQELGYKVFEVNTSSLRNGKKILSRLQEATQSHQVAQNKDGIPPPVFSNNDSASTPKADDKKNKLPAAFTNLFNKGKTTTEPDKDNEKVKDKSKKRKREKDSELTDDKPSKKKKKTEEHMEKLSQLYHKDDSNQAGGLNLTSTSVILFDEVDLVFEKDVGFLAAVQYFMNTTKIPIILTTTNRNIAIQARLEVLKFDPPSLKLTASHLQTICLVEGVRTQHKDLVQLVQYYNNDVRRCLLALQFWVESGGSRCRIQQAVCKNSQLSAVPEDSDQEDFVPVKTKTRGLRILEEDSNDKAVMSNLPQVHTICLESVLGLTNKISYKLNNFITLGLQQTSKADHNNALLHCCEVLRSLRLNLLKYNILHLVPLPHTCLSKHTTNNNKTPVKKRTRILDSEDCDSETSNSEPPKHSQDSAQIEPKLHSETHKEKQHISKCLQSFSKYYDSCSVLDNIQTSMSIKDIDNPLYRHGVTFSQDVCLSDKPSTYQSSHSWLLPQHTDIVNNIEVHSSKLLCEEIQDIYLQVQKKEPHYHEVFLDKLSIPLPNGVSKFSSQYKVQKLEQNIIDAHDNILSNLPPSTSRDSVATDYLPYLRAMHFTECLKKTEKAKRRFHHHFDNIGLTLKKSTLLHLQQDLQ